MENKKFEGRLVINGPKKMKRTYKVLGDSVEEVEQKVKRITKQFYKTNLVWDCQLRQIKS